MTKTTRIVRSAIPGESSGNYGYVALISLPLAPWEQPTTKDEAWRQAREMGAYVRTHHNDPKKGKT